MAFCLVCRVEHLDEFNKRVFLRASFNIGLILSELQRRVCCYNIVKCTVLFNFQSDLFTYKNLAADLSTQLILAVRSSST